MSEQRNTITRLIILSACAMLFVTNASIAIEKKGGTIAVENTDATKEKSADEAARADSRDTHLPAHPVGITSFGAAVCNGSIFTFGGHEGETHRYYREGQNRMMRRIELPDGKEWIDVAEGPGLQGLALVSHRDVLYRIGGFEARNGRDESTQDLHSFASFARFDFASKQWAEQKPLPAGRSSFDATVHGDILYVVGGWEMQGVGQEPVWHHDALSLDLGNQDADWVKLPQPPFRRRALAIAADNEHLFVVGGMQEHGGPTTRCDVLNLETHEWSDGPATPGKPIAGFGVAALNHFGTIYASTVEGQLLRLSPNRDKWQLVTEFAPGRFFHRMLSVDSERIAIVGGANMEIGKLKETLLLNASPKSNSAD